MCDESEPERIVLESDVEGAPHDWCCQKWHQQHAREREGAEHRVEVGAQASLGDFAPQEGLDQRCHLTRHALDEALADRALPETTDPAQALQERPGARGHFAPGGSEISSVPWATHASLPSFVTSTRTTADRLPSDSTVDSAVSVPFRTALR